MAKKNKKKKDTTTKDIVEVSDIRDNIVVLKNGSLRTVIEVTSMNFELKSQDEQKAIIIGFQDFLNALDFPVQISVSSRRLNLNNYLSSVQELVSKLDNDLLKIQGTEYVRFIGGLSELANIVAKHFYIVVPYYISEAAGKSTSGLVDKIKGIFSPSSVTHEIDEDKLQEYSGQLQQRVDVVAAGITRLGLSAKMLRYDNLIDLYYSYFNPDLPAVAETQSELNKNG